MCHTSSVPPHSHNVYSSISHFLYATLPLCYTSCVLFLVSLCEILSCLTLTLCHFLCVILPHCTFILGYTTSVLLCLCHFKVNLRLNHHHYLPVSHYLFVTPLHNTTLGTQLLCHFYYLPHFLSDVLSVLLPYHTTSVPHLLSITLLLCHTPSITLYHWYSASVFCCLCIILVSAL